MYLVDADCHPQTVAVVVTRAEARGVAVKVLSPEQFEFGPGVIGCLVQYPATDGALRDFRAICSGGPRRQGAGHRGHRPARAHAAGAARANGAQTSRSATASASACPIGYGGPHAAFFATKDEYKRHMPGRIIGVSKDRDGRPALRMALQTREQHIRREKATSNVCTAQVLLAVMASMYAVYHGPDGLRRIAERTHNRTVILANALRRLRYRIVHEHFFDTLCVEVERWALPRIVDAARSRQINLRVISPTRLGVALDETTSLGDVADLITIFSLNEALPFMLEDIGGRVERAIPRPLRAGRAPTSPIPSSTSTSRKRRCCDTSSDWRRATCRCATR